MSAKKGATETVKGATITEDDAKHTTLVLPRDHPLNPDLDVRSLTFEIPFGGGYVRESGFEVGEKLNKPPGGLTLRCEKDERLFSVIRKAYLAAVRRTKLGMYHI